MMARVRYFKLISDNLGVNLLIYLVKSGDVPPVLPLLVSKYIAEQNFEFPAHCLAPALLYPPKTLSFCQILVSG